MKTNKQKPSKLDYRKSTITELNEAKFKILASDSISWSVLIVAGIEITKKMHITIHNI